MDRRILSVFALFAALLFGVRLTVPSAPQGPAATTTPETYQGAAPNPTPTLERPDGIPQQQQINSLLERIRAYAPTRRCEIWPIITPVADPRRTSLGLLFDREMEAIQVAAAERGYFRLAQELPWGNAKKDAAASRRDSGFILFRREEEPPRYLALLLVPEGPTRGIDAPSFQVALGAAHELQRNLSGHAKDTVFIMGPRFSASAAFMARMSAQIKAISGTITGSSLFSVDPHAQLHATQIDDKETVTQFVRVLQSGYHFKPLEIAVVSETETVYGAQELKSELKSELESVRHYHFPRNIARLRNAYAPILQQLGSTAGQTTRPVLPDVFDESQPDSRDELPSFGGKQTPIVQEAQLLAIANAMKADRIRVAGILATDSLDTLFLLQFFRRTAPDILLFVRDPDLLFSHASRAFSLRGVLAVNSFGLFDRNHIWLAKRTRSVNVFSSSYDAGDFYAFYEILQQIDGVSPDNDSYMSVLNTWPGSPSANVPPIWLMSIGTSGYEPLAILNEPWSGSKVEESARTAALRTIRNVDPGRPPRFLLVLWGGLVCLGLLHLGAILSESGGKKQSVFHWVPQRWRPDFACSTKVTDSFVAARAMCHATALAALAFALLVLGSAFVFFKGCREYETVFHLSEYPAFAKATVVAAGLLIVGSLYVFIWTCVRPWLALRRRSDSSNQQCGREQQHATALPLSTIVANGAVGLVLLLGPIVVWSGSAFRHDYDLMALHIRDLNLLSGVSPIIPILALLTIIYVGVWTYERRVTYHDSRCAPLPQLQLDTVFEDDFTHDAEAIERSLLHTSPLVVLGPIVILAVFAAIFAPWRTLIGFEPYWLRVITLELFLFATMILLMHWMRLLAVWSRLRNILECLAGLPILDAFRRIAASHPGSMWSWAAGSSLYERLRRSAEGVRVLRQAKIGGANFAAYADGLETALRRITPSVAQPMATAAAAASAGSTTVPVTASGETAQPADDPLQQALTAENEILKDLNSVLLSNYWSCRWTGMYKDATIDVNTRNFMLAEDLVAFRFYLYIRYVVTQIRNLIFFIAAAFTLLAVAMSSYVFLGAQTTSWMVFALFVFLAAGIVTVFAQMERNTVLSTLEGSSAGELGKNFYFNILRYGAVPVLTLLASMFPSISGFFLRWVQPNLNLLK